MSMASQLQCRLGFNAFDWFFWFRLEEQANNFHQPRHAHYEQVHNTTSATTFSFIVFYVLDAPSG